MGLNLLFWILFIVAIVFYGYRNRDTFLDSLVFWVLIGLLGVAEFGWPIK